jgi:DNA-binding CsgD family transcriptional regulator
MRIWKTNPQSEKFPISQSGLFQLLAAITNDDPKMLPQAMLNLVRSEVDMLNCAVFLLPATGQPLLLGHAESRPSSAPSASGAYVEQYYQRDIALQEVLRRNTSMSGSTILLHQSAHDIVDPAYRNACYDNAGTTQRFGIFRQLKDNNNLFIGIYRSACAQALSPADLHYLELLADCLGEAAVQRYSVMPQAYSLSANKLDLIQSELKTKLSKREYDLILHIARGLTIPAASRAMGIKAASAVTYRNRGFAKLNIRTQQELFAKLIERVEAAPDFSMKTASM